MCRMTTVDAMELLPAHLRERTTCASGFAIVPASRAYVLCWMHHAVRDDEQPALDAALAIGAAIDLPVLVYMGLGGRHPYNSDRHHRFILEGARDLAEAIKRRRIAFIFHLPEDPAQGGPLAAIAEQAAAVVTEDFPVPPINRWMTRLAQRSDVPVLLVDCACLHPLRLGDRRFARAFEFRAARAESWAQRLRTPWPDAAAPVAKSIDVHQLSRDITSLRAVDLLSADLGELIAGCRIDHGVPTLADTPGGMHAARARWSAFCAGPIHAYHRHRNDALRSGVSRMSAYLHHGHISPFLVARGTARMSGAGPAKYLDELLVWRELAHHFCAVTDPDDLHSLRALPLWAQATLREHAVDGRADVPCDEALDRGRTGDELWDAAQQSLLLRGELHNNVRMTWGKAIVGWSRSPAHALRQLIELNHRYALDGSDPNSYGGLLWCMGLFDRPFAPPTPVLGSVRPCPTEEHAQRLDAHRWKVRIAAPLPRCRIAVVGGGIAGLSAARSLADHGMQVTVFDKGRGPGGRCATRRITADHGTASFDHGTAIFSARDPRFLRMLHMWEQCGVVAQWPAHLERIDADGGRVQRTAHGWTGMPGMNALVRHLGAELGVRFGAKIAHVFVADAGYELVETDGARHGPFDRVVVAVPAPQAADVLQRVAPAFAARCAAIRFLPRTVAMVESIGEATNEALGAVASCAWDILEDRTESPLSIAFAAHRRPAAQEITRPRWTLHASAEWSAEHLEEDPDQTAQILADAFTRCTACPVRVCAGHRWRFARCAQPDAQECLLDDACRIGVCGDGFGAADVEGAWLSGQALAGRMLGRRSWSVAREHAAEPSLFGP